MYERFKDARREWVAPVDMPAQTAELVKSVLQQQQLIIESNALLIRGLCDVPRIIDVQDLAQPLRAGSVESAPTGKAG